jgi:peptidyl-prolyl cis-trans isomerase D
MKAFVVSRVPFIFQFPAISGRRACAIVEIPHLVPGRLFSTARRAVPDAAGGIRLLRRRPHVPIIRALFPSNRAAAAADGKATDMLQAIRQKTSSIVAIGLFGLLILSFAVWGIGDIFRATGPTNVIAEVGAVEIPAEALLNEFQRSIRNVQRQTGVRLDTQQAQDIGLLDQALEQLLTKTVLDVKAAELGVAISDDAINRTIQSDPAFRNQFGQFDPNIFRSTLFNNGLNESGFIALLRSDLARRQVISSVAMLDTAPRVLSGRLYDYRNESRVAETIQVAAADQAFEPPAEADLRAYYEANKDRFMAPEYRKLTAVILAPAALIGEIEIDDQVLRDEYDGRRAEFETPEQRGVEQIVFDDEAKAKEAAALLGEGRAFAAVAEEMTGAAPLSLGEVTASELGLPALGNAAFALAEGAVSAPVESPLGWHILRVTKIVPGSVRSFEAVRETLREELARAQAIDDLSEVANRLEDELGGGASIEEGAHGVGLDVLRVDAVDASGAAPDGAPVDGLPADPQFLQVAFESDPGVDSFLTETEDGYFILRVDSITGAAPKDFEAVRADSEEAVRGERQLAAAEDRAEELLALAEGNASLADVATEQGLRLATSQPVTRIEQDAAAGISPTVTAALFELAVGEVGMAPTGDGYTVFRLKEVIAADAAADTAGAERVATETAGAVRNDLLQQLDRAIRQHHEVTVDERAIEGLI